MRQQLIMLQKCSIQQLSPVYICFPCSRLRYNIVYFYIDVTDILGTEMFCAVMCFNVNFFFIAKKVHPIFSFIYFLR